MRDTTELSLATLEINKLEALLELMILAAYADGEANDAERRAFREHVKAATSGRLMPEVMDAIFHHLAATRDSQAREERLASIRERLPDERERKAALNIASAIVRADGIVKISEKEFMMRVSEALGLEGYTDVES